MERYSGAGIDFFLTLTDLKLQIKKSLKDYIKIPQAPVLSLLLSRNTSHETKENTVKVLLTKCLDWTIKEENELVHK